MKPVDCPTTALAAVEAAPRAACPACGSDQLLEFFQMPRIPVHVGVLHRSPDEARAAPTGSIALAYCHRCRLVHNRLLEPQKLVFEPGYEVQLVHSPLFRRFLADVAQRLVARYDLRGKRLVDVGCGAGHFLRLLCEAGGNDGLGIDPTLPESETVSLAAGRLQLLRDLFGPQHAAVPCDFVACQSVLEDIPDPVSFIGLIRQMLLPLDGVAYLEVFNAWRAFEAGEIWSLCYEQCNYYGVESFVETVRRAGFEILESGSCYGQDQYVYVEARPSAMRPAAPEPPGSPQPLPDVVARFGKLYSERIEQWRGRIDRYRAERRRVALWGSGGKAICFLNSLEATDVFSVVIDINPNRQGHYLPGTAQPVVSPGWLQVNPVDVIVISNPLYESEIRATVRELGVTCEFERI